MNMTVILEQKHVDSLKKLATRLGVMQTRGVGKGILPSLSAVIRLLADLSENEDFVSLVVRLMREKEAGNGEGD